MSEMRWEEGTVENKWWVKMGESGQLEKQLKRVLTSPRYAVCRMRSHNSEDLKRKTKFWVLTSVSRYSEKSHIKRLIAGLDCNSLLRQSLILDITEKSVLKKTSVSI